ncbi:hypothetical protein EYF80_040018 [Liparis tanakae]|uniref:Uncharacterized protein n=1 Tax=Liparis tanakae TaxID=230148 RepID=A0A4Z2GAH2_9TELE|nr:hypothetical protein EYF80_040018 [Liparis tanakae]
MISTYCGMSVLKEQRVLLHPQPAQERLRLCFLLCTVTPLSRLKEVNPPCRGSPVNTAGEFEPAQLQRPGVSGHRELHHGGKSLFCPKVK